MNERLSQKLQNSAGNQTQCWNFFLHCIYLKAMFAFHIKILHFWRHKNHSYIFYSALQHYSAKSKCCLQVITLVIRTNTNNELTWVFILFKHVCLKRSITDVTWDHWLFRVFWVCQHQKPFLRQPSQGWSDLILLSSGSYSWLSLQHQYLI